MIAEITGKPSRVAGAGRTDAGVHATGQVASFTTESELSANEWLRALNGHLPPTITVVDLWDAPAAFHARFSALSRRYRYTIFNRPSRPAVDRQFVWHVAAPLDMRAMEAAASLLLGEHDFTAFAGATERIGPRGNIRRVIDARWRRDGDRLSFEIEADAFLPRMVRNIVGLSVEVGAGRQPFGLVAELLTQGTRSRLVKPAPANGLCLVLVHYGESNDQDARS